MAKYILMSIKPKYVSMILNKTKTIEVRKRFPSDYVGWVYIYCTKDHNNLLHKNCAGIWWVEDKDFQKKNKRLGIEQQPIYNGKVVARFWCDKVEEHKDFGMFPYSKLRCDKATCLSEEDLENYGFVEGKGYVPLYAIHITNLEIFDKPKEINEFNAYCKKSGMECLHCKHYWTDDSAGYSIPKCSGKPLTRAPQSFCFIEID